MEPELRTDTERLDTLPDRERDSRPDTERRDCEEREERDEAREPVLPEPREPRPPAVIPVGGEPTLPPDGTSGARPQVSQYSSPPPMSSYAPSHPGRRHCCRLSPPLFGSFGSFG
ncbi:hypothetical protein [Streptomyces fructofermentans]|uniref:Uncharacterized protein n=1 Tax=Streptomyces fructofermentans TaxID=152141 RepID=A0A918KAT8_9ACTN|nr:hypothetical protein GCM10010515_22280 [Streptomyces fructofermentans]